MFIAIAQYRFRPGFSTEDVVNDLVVNLVKELDKRNKCLGIFLGLSKTFDTVPVNTSLLKLQKTGIRGLALQTFRDYLSNRKQCVRIGSQTSDAEVITFGVPQGSILGPILFLVYINEVCSLSIPNCKMYTYANDTALLMFGKDWKMINSYSEAALRAVGHWLSVNHLILNKEKSLYVPILCDLLVNHTKRYTIQLHSCKMPFANCACVTLTRAELDERLNWNKYVETLTAHVRRLIYVFKTLRYSAVPDTLRMEYLGIDAIVVLHFSTGRSC